MADENRGDTQADGVEGVRPASGAQQGSGDPGRTPGKAEGDEETIEESLEQKES
jgi:hypothetical protein